MRVVGLDVSRTVAEIAYLEDGEVKSGGRVELVHAVLTRWAATQLRATDHVVLEATGNTAAVVNAVRPHVARVVVANPFQVRLIAEARVKTDKIDAAVLAQLYASGFLPEVWIPDDGTQTLRRQVARRAQIVRQRVRDAVKIAFPARNEKARQVFADEEVAQKARIPPFGGDVPGDGDERRSRDDAQGEHADPCSSTT